MTGLNACIMFDPPPADEAIPQPEPAAAPDNDWHPITPIPADAPLPPALRSGQAGTDYEYRNAEGGLLMIVRRFDLPDGSKDIRPLTFWRHPDGRREWRWKGLPAPRPLYGLDRLAARPDAPVLIVEGEKAADAAAKLFPDHVAVTSQNGAKAADKADWSPLAGRQVTIWPDHDAEGATYAADVACLMQVTGAALVKTVSIPDSFPAKWDLRCQYNSTNRRWRRRFDNDEGRQENHCSMQGPQEKNPHFGCARTLRVDDRFPCERRHHRLFLWRHSTCY